MLDHTNYSSYISGEFPYLDLKKKILKIMGQFLEYLTSVFAGITSSTEKSSTNNHVTFADSSFSSAFGRGNQEQNSKLTSLRQTNRRTLLTFEFIVIITTLMHFFMVLLPKIQVDTFEFFEPEGWQLVTLNVMPFLVQIAAICAMSDLNKPLPEGSKLTSKNAGLNMNNNEFIYSLKVIVCVMAACQVLAVFSDLLLWSVVLILPLWCYKLTSKLASSEFERHAPSAKKPWVKLNVPKSPKAVTPAKATRQPSDDNKATPRTRTKKAVKSFLNNVSDKYHAFEQNVATQISQRMNSPMGQNTKMIDYSSR